jgi:phosphoglycolate phosphatase
VSLKLAIWDMDGTIVDSREVITTAMDRAFVNMGLEAPGYERTRTIVGLGLHECVRILAPEDYPEARIPALAEAYKEAFVLRRTDPDFKEPLYAGAMEALERLRDDGWLIAMATGKSHRGIRAVFSHHPLEPFFDTIWCADDGPGKPNPFMVEQAMGALGADVSQSIMIGDAIYDMQMGRAAGVRTLGVSWGFGETHELEPHADEVHHSFETLNATLKDFVPG